MEHNLAMKKNKRLPFEAIWMDLENIKISDQIKTNII